jgi:hypothetical protein
MMDLDGQIKLGHLLLHDRKCRTCGEIKNLVESFIEQEKTEVQLHHHILMNVRNVLKG